MMEPGWSFSPDRRVYRAADDIGFGNERCEVKTVRVGLVIQEAGLRGTSGYRGEASRFTGRTVDAIAGGFVQALSERFPGVRQVGVAGDLRASTPPIMRDLAHALARRNLAVVNLGQICTPAAALWAMENNAASAIVTGSHIPGDENGLKWNVPGGEIDSAFAERVKAQDVEQANMLFDGAGRFSIRYDLEAPVAAARDAYFARYDHVIPSGALRGIRVAVLLHSSVSADLLADLYELKGAEVLRLDRYPHFTATDTEALGVELAARARAIAAECSPDIILGTDPDGDRPLVFDEYGNFVRGDVVGIVVGRWLRAEAVVMPCSCNTGVMRGGFSKVYHDEVPIGSMHVLAFMRHAEQAGARVVLGYEANGGQMLGTEAVVWGRRLGALPTRDSVPAHLAFMANLAEQELPVSEQVARLKLPATASGLIRFPCSVAAPLVAALAESTANGRDLSALNRIFRPLFGEVYKVLLTDGVRMYLAEGRTLHIRASGNSDDFRAYAECPTQKEADECVRRALDLMSEWESKQPL